MRARSELKGYLKSLNFLMLFKKILDTIFYVKTNFEAESNRKHSVMFHRSKENKSM